MTIWVRNCHTPFTLDSWGTSHMVMLQAELLRLAKFTLDSDDGDAAWTAANNIILNVAAGIGGFEVDAADPTIIYDPGARFTQAMVDNEHMITLLASNDQNRSAWRITEFIDTSHIRVDLDGFNPYGWVTETQMAGRVVTFAGTRLTAGAWAIFNAPTPSRMQVRLSYVDTSNAYIYGRPMGQPYAGTGAGTPDAIAGTAPNMTLDIAGGKFNKHMPGSNVTIAGAANPLDDGTFPITAVSPTGQITYTNAVGVGDANFTGTFSVAGLANETNAGLSIGDYYNNRMRAHVVADGVGNYYYYARNQDGDRQYVWVGLLEDTPPEDTDPGFVFGQGTNTGSPVEFALRMLDGAVSPSAIYAYMSDLKRDDSVITDNAGFHAKFGWRLSNGSPGKTLLRRPNVALANTVTVGACRRGRMPIVRLSYSGFQASRPIDSVGAWLFWRAGLCFPRNGPGDPLPIAPTAS